MQVALRLCRFEKSEVCESDLASCLFALTMPDRDHSSCVGRLGSKCTLRGGDAYGFEYLKKEDCDRRFSSLCGLV